MGLFGPKKKKEPEQIESTTMETRTRGIQPPPAPIIMPPRPPMPPVGYRDISELPIPPSPTPPLETVNKIESVAEYLEKEYGGAFSVQDFDIPSPESVSEAQKCTLLFAIFSELKELKEEIKKR